jgi:hypothetical protein
MAIVPAYKIELITCMAKHILRIASSLHLDGRLPLPASSPATPTAKTAIHRPGDLVSIKQRVSRFHAIKSSSECPKARRDDAEDTIAFYMVTKGSNISALNNQPRTVPCLPEH